MLQGKSSLLAGGSGRYLHGGQHPPGFLVSGRTSQNAPGASVEDGHFCADCGNRPEHATKPADTAPAMGQVLAFLSR